jgi:hypothetical protein
MRHLLFFAGAVVARWLQVGELLNGPLFDLNVWESLQQRFRRLARTQERRVKEERRLAVAALRESLCLRVAKLCQRIGDVVARHAPCVRHTLAMANEENTGGLAGGGVGHCLWLGQGIGGGRGKLFDEFEGDVRGEDSAVFMLLYLHRIHHLAKR